MKILYSTQLVFTKIEHVKSFFAGYGSFQQVQYYILLVLGVVSPDIYCTANLKLRLHIP